MVFDAAGDDHGRARFHLSMGLLAQRRRRTEESLKHHLAALKAYERVGDQPGLANAMNNVAMNHLELGHDQRALDVGLRALEMAETSGAWATAVILNTVGTAWRRQGDHRRAAECYRRSVDLVRRVGDRFHEALALHDLAQASEAAGDKSSAERARAQAVDTLKHLNEADPHLGGIHPIPGRTKSIKRLGRQFYGR